MICNACDNINSQPTKFVNLHVHSCYSLLDGLSKIEDIVAKVKRMKQSSFAITEHGNVFSAVKAHKLARENSLKHLYGIEFYVTKDRFVKDKASKYNHLTVLAKNEQGRLNINKLSSLGYIEGFYSKPRVDHQLLKENKEGLVVLSGCMASEFQQALAGGKIGDDDVNITAQNIENAKNVARFYHNIFGEDYYMEVQSHSDFRQQKLNRAVVDIAKELSIPYVVTADSHFVDEEDFELHGIFIQIGTNRESGETYLDGQLQSEEEARRLLKPALTDEEIDEAIRYTAIIADKCNVNLPLSAPIIPHVTVPKPFKTEAEYLKHLCVKGWNRLRLNEKPNAKEYQQRLLYEFDAITKMGFEGYYLLVESYANSVKRRGIARGSGGGSLVAYLLNIINIDPIKYGLYFERFIDVGALDLLEKGEITRNELKIPDFDLDFGKIDRGLVIDYIIERYGEDKFASLGQFGMLKDKTAIKDVGKVLGISFDVTNKITKIMDADTIDEAVEEGKLDEYVKKHPKLFDYAKRIAGVPKSFGIHPSGKAITINNLFDYTAVTKNDETIVFQGDMHDTDDLGVVKIDALGLRTIDVIYSTLDLIGKDDDYISPENLNFEDEKVLQVFRDGHTDGCFQFESTGMRDTLRKMMPTGLDDLAVANALFRPGSMKFIDVYTRRKHGEEDVVYLHEDLKSILQPTYAVIVFQEQLIEIGRFAKMKNPDLLRKATGKKDAKLMAKVKPELVQGLKNRGWNDSTIDELWDIMVEFSKYSFNKSHSYAYAMIAFMTAFLKTYHPKEFICALFNSFIGTNMQNKYEYLERTYAEAKRLDVSVEFPTELEDFSGECFVKGDKAIYGMQLVKTINAQSPKEMSKLAGKQYDTFVGLVVDIMTNTHVQPSHMKIFVELGLFDKYGSKDVLLEIYSCMNGTKKANFELYPEFANYVEIVKGEEKIKKIPLKYDPNHVEKTRIQRLENLYKYEQLVRSRPPKNIGVGEQILYEKEMLGFPISTFDEPSSFAVVTSIDAKYTPKVVCCQTSTGKETMFKIKKPTFFDRSHGELVSVGDHIEILSTFKDGKWIRKPESEVKPGEFPMYQDMNQLELFIGSLRHIK